MESHPFQQEIQALRNRLSSEGRNAQLRQASSESLAWLRSMRIPESVVAFYAVAEPSRWVDIEGLEIGPVAGLKSDNTQAVPGIAASRYGYVVIAKTISGDAYCLDVNQADSTGQTPVYLVNHEKVGETATRSDVEAWSRLVTPSFQEFLTRFIEGDLPYDFDQA